MKRGKAPRPTTLRLLEGARPDKVNDNEPVPPADLPLPPETLSDEARDIWDYTVQQLEHMGIASAADRDSLACYCEAVVRHRQASVLLAKSGMILRGLHGGPVRNPAVGMQRDAAHTVRAFAQEFGLTPSGRTRIEVGAQDADDENPFAASG